MIFTDRHPSVTALLHMVSPAAELQLAWHHCWLTGPAAAHTQHSHYGPADNPASVCSIAGRGPPCSAGGCGWPRWRGEAGCWLAQCCWLEGRGRTARPLSVGTRYPRSRGRVCAAQPRAQPDHNTYTQMLAAHHRHQIPCLMQQLILGIITPPPAQPAHQLSQLTVRLGRPRQWPRY